MESTKQEEQQPEPIAASPCCVPTKAKEEAGRALQELYNASCMAQLSAPQHEGLRKKAEYVAGVLQGIGVPPQPTVSVQ